MKMKSVLSNVFFLGLILIAAAACKTETKTETQQSEVVVTEPELKVNNIITENVGKYPRDINLFENEEIVSRLKFLTGENYLEMLSNFNVETPIVSENGIYKVTGCKQHDCPAYHTTILFDAHNDNMNVLINQDGKIKGFAEKATIDLTETLEML